MMRKIPWCTPGELKKLTPRLMHALATTVLPGEEKDTPAAPEPEDGQPQPPSPKRGSRAEYDALVRLVTRYGSGKKEDADAEWLAKRGPIPPKG